MIKEGIEEYVRCLRQLETFHAEDKSKKSTFIAPVHMHEFVLKFGKIYLGQPLPKKYRLRPIKQCFDNARRLTERSKALQYCEGFVASADLPLIIHHAWAVNKKGEVIDPTLRAFKNLDASGGERGHYMGVTFPAYFVRRYWRGAMLECYYTGFRLDVMRAYEELNNSGLLHCTPANLNALA